MESPYIELGQIFTSLYFMYFLVFVPFLNLLEYYLEYNNLISPPSPHSFVNLPIQQSIVPSYFQLRFLAHISKYSSIYAFFISMFVIIIFKLNFDSTYIVSGSDPQEGQNNTNGETTNPVQMGNTDRVLDEVALTYGQNVADKLFEDDNLLQEMDKLSEKDAMALAEKYIEDNNIVGSN